MKRFDPRMAALAIFAALLFGLGSAAPAAGPRTHIVMIASMKYAPSTLTVYPGDRVTFRNAGIVPHTVTEKASKAFNSGILNPGDQWTLVVPNRTGVIHYHCLLHPLMEGSITVEPPPA